MKCCDCFKPRTNSPDLKTQSAPAAVVSSVLSPGAKQTVLGVERDGGGVTKPKPQAKFAQFEEVLKSKKGMAALREYMTTIQEAHVLEFLEDVKSYRSEPDAAARAKSAQTIFSTYIAVCSDREVSLDRPVRDAVVNQLSDAAPQLFDAAEGAVLEELRRDVFPQFLNTALFKSLAGLA